MQSARLDVQYKLCPQYDLKDPFYKLLLLQALQSFKDKSSKTWRHDSLYAIAYRIL
jgi:hypothetical protein